MSIPSWAVDWITRERPTQIGLPKVGNHVGVSAVYSAGGSYGLGFRLEDSESTLVLSGTILDRIGFVVALPDGVKKGVSFWDVDTFEEFLAFTDEARYLDRPSLNHFLSVVRNWLVHFGEKSHLATSCEIKQPEERDQFKENFRQSMSFSGVFETIQSLKELDHLNGHKYEPTSEPLFEAAIRTFCADVFMNNFRYAGRLSAERFRDNQDSALTEMTNSLMHTLGRSFMASASGYIGLGPPDAKEGDVMCVVKGYEVPLLLRPRGDGNYTFVGECYVHGVMDGEVFREKPQDVGYGKENGRVVELRVV